MNRTVEISAKTLDEAITKGCAELGVGLEDVDFEVVDEGGVFRKMVVKITVKGDAAGAAAAEPTPAPAVQVESGSVEEFEIVGKGKPAPQAAKAAAPKPVPEFDPNCPKFTKTLAFAKEFFALMGDNLTVTTDHNDHEFIIAVDGDDVSRLIGKEGKTMAAINTIISGIAISTHTGEPRRVVVDIANYRAKRKDNLVALALRKAEYVKQSGKSVKLEAMPARERVVVHMALQDVEGIITQSEGVEPHRYLVIKPGAR